MIRPASSLVSLLAVVVVLAMAACRGGSTRHPAADREPADEARQLQAHLADNPGDVEARRDLGLLQWIHLGKPSEGLENLARAGRSGALYAQVALLIAADARLHPSEVDRWATKILRATAEPDLDAHRAAVARLAVHKLEQHHGTLPGDDARFLELYGELMERPLVPEVRERLLSMRASIARRRDQPWKRYYRRQGCVQDWEVGQVEGQYGVLELPEAQKRPFVSDENPDTSIVALACVVRLWNPTPRAGMRRIRARMDVPTQELRLDLASQRPMRVYLDGTLIHRTDRVDRWPDDQVQLLLDVEPGLHRLEIATAIPEERAWVLTRAIDGKGQPVPVVADGSRASAAPFRGTPRRRTVPWGHDPGPLDGPHQAPLRSYLAVEDASIDGATDRSEMLVRVLRPMRSFAEGQWLVARVERDDPSRGRTTSAAREQSHLEDSLAADPGLDAARLRLLRLIADRGDQAEVRRRLAALGQEQLRGIEGQLLRWQVARAQDNVLQAQRALQRAEAIHPDHCDVLMAKRTRARSRDDVATEDALTRRLAHCGGSTELRARHAARRGQLEHAQELWHQAHQRVPDDVQAMAALAELAIRRGSPSRAIELHRSILRHNPYRVGSHLAIADLLAREGDRRQAKRHLRQAIDRIPHSSALRRVGTTMGLVDDLQRFRVDGQRAIERYRATEATPDGAPAVLVLDRSVARVYPNHGMRVLVHLVVHLLTKEALDQYGEITVPEGADLLTLHSIKPDGTRIEPESIAGKEGVSLRDLEVGDVVEYEYVVEQDPASLLPGYVDVTTFRFQSLDTPYHRSELVVVHPEDLDIQEERRNSPPEARIEHQEGLVVRRWVARDMPRLGVEPHHPALLDVLPNVRVYTELGPEAWLETVRLQLRSAQRTNLELRQLVRRLTRGHTDDHARLQALWHWVRENVDDSSDLSSSATATLAAGQGNRLMLLRTMLRQAGIRAELWLGRNRFGPSIVADGNPMVESYDTPMLAVWLAEAEQPTMVMTGSDVMPLGYVPPPFSGSRALRVHLGAGDGPHGSVRIPEPPTDLTDARRYQLAIELDPRGHGKIQGQIELQGMEAIAWRQALRQVDPDRIEEVFQKVELGRMLRGATVSSLSIENERELTRPLVLRFRADAESLGVEQGGVRVLPSALVPMNPGKAYAGLASRDTGLVVPYGPLHEATIELSLSKGRLASIPESRQIQNRFGHFERAVGGQVGSQTLVMHMRSSLRPGIVDARAYPELAELTSAIETAEQAAIRIR